MVESAIFAIVIASVAGLIVLVGCPVAIVTIIVRHKQKLEELRHPKPIVQAMPAADVAALREEIVALRNTTMQYDLSVEKALVEIRRRLSAIEMRAQPASYADASINPAEMNDNRLIAGSQRS